MTLSLDRIDNSLLFVAWSSQLYNKRGQWLVCDVCGNTRCWGYGMGVQGWIQRETRISRNELCISVANYCSYCTTAGKVFWKAGPICWGMELKWAIKRRITRQINSGGCKALTCLLLFKSCSNFCDKTVCPLKISNLVECQILQQTMIAMCSSLAWQPCDLTLCH